MIRYPIIPGSCQKLQSILVRTTSSKFIKPRAVHPIKLTSFHTSSCSFSQGLAKDDLFSQPTAKDVGPSILATYSAPLSKTFVRLKIFSLSSLAAAITLTPALLLAPAEIGWSGRIGLCITALATSGASTAIFAWIGKPYVGSMRLLSPSIANQSLQKDCKEMIGKTSNQTSLLNGIDLSISKPALQTITIDWRLRKLQTTIYEPDLIRPTSRPLATWELASKAPIPQDIDENCPFPITRLVASTRMEKNDELVGRYWATWQAPKLAGDCTQEGNIIRHYSIHEELLGDDWRVL
ncbi:uncharacterized protein FA14DRAFT_159524 [Meira miltonrushii]|uniref:Uncharacterized protein n=1 Tax=Meira miltonrushii TaxID=1280837 RepID=A0A316VPU5_9BASI|nr:uncharacterized protein FA14DRAFT_159524 [Meira miltonrushii]PWN37495.1 hypothetical protein FA14DRAFT_159524 [Meira miltonrushii]